MNRSFARLRNTITALAVITLGTVVVASPGIADGNNGTVKIDGWTLDHGTGNGAPNRNEPHLDCVFDIEWYNYDASVTSTVTFESQSPTQDVVLGGTTPASVVLDNDDDTGASAAGLDATQQYTLTFTGDPHPVHGYHVKLTVNTPISNGADAKHKVFWVEGCTSERVPLTPAPQVNPSTCVQGVYTSPTLVATPLVGATAGPVTYSGDGDGVWEPGETANVSYTVIDAGLAYLTQSDFEFDFLPSWPTDDRCSPPPCPNGDFNGDAPGCDPPPPPCPGGEQDWNGPNEPGCGNPPTPPAPQQLEETVEGCILTQYGINQAGVATRTGLREYVWVPSEPPIGNGSWQLEPLENVAWTAWQLTEMWVGQTYKDRCAGDQPPALVREVAGVQASCRLRGTMTWVDVYTTEFVWNEETQAWEPGTETGPVRTDETFVEYTNQQFQNRCAEEPEVAGEQETIDHVLPEVKGEQADVPGAVNAGLGPVPAPFGMERNPLWLLLLGGGLGLIGVAGMCRRPRRTGDPHPAAEASR